MAGEQPVDHSDVLNKVTGGSGGSGVFETTMWLFRERFTELGAALSTAIGRPHSLWTLPGSPSHGTAPGSNRNPTNATDGALKQSSPSGGRKKWLVSIDAYGGPVSFDGILFDRLADTSGLSGTSTSLQTINLSVSRFTGTDAVGNVMMVEVYTGMGTTAQTLTVNYVDENGNSQTSSCIVGSGTWPRLAPSVVFIPYAAGGRGVRSVTSVQLAGSTLVAGDFGITIARPICKFGGQAGLALGEDLLSGPLSGPIQIDDAACLYVVQNINASNSQEVLIELKFLES